MTFNRQEAYKKRLEDNWRRPRGWHSKVRLGKRGHPRKPSQGHRTALEDRGMHNGLEIVRVERPEQVKELDPKKHAIVVASVGARKRIAIIEAAEQFEIINASKQTADTLKEKFKEKQQEHAKRKKERKKKHEELEKKAEEASKEAEESEEKEEEKKPHTPKKDENIEKQKKQAKKEVTGPAPTE